MKKLFVLFFSLVAIFTLASCDFGNSHEHEFGKEWKHDETMHWRECSCGEKDQQDEHKGGTATETKKAKCSVCGQSYGELVEPEHVHSYEKKSDATHHWTECACGATTEKEAHKGGAATITEKAQCEDCGVSYGELLPVPTYQITYEINGHGEQPEALTEVTALPSTLPVLTADGYKFEGWYLEAEFTTLAIAGSKLSSNITLYAKWTEVIDLSGVVFADKEFIVDGSIKSLAVENLPEGCTVEYENNNHTNKGTYVVTATIKDANGEILDTMEATLKIVPDPEEMAAYPYLTSIGIDPTKTHTAYQLLVYSFYDSDGDGYGDLKGVEQKLDYIAGLGADMIWLSPIMAAESYHAYDITSFYAIDEKLGTTVDFKSLVNKAHEKGIKIILDMPINHTSNEHEWFKAYLNGDEQYAEYYQTYDPSVSYGSGGFGTFYTDEETGKKYFGAFGKTMPDLNYQSEELKQGVQEVFEYWIDLGADGFRLDAIKHIYDPNEIPSYQNSVQMNNDYFAELRANLKAINPNIYLVGENFSGQWEVAQYAQSFDAEFDFDSWQTGLGAVAAEGPWGGGLEKRIYFDDTVVGCTNELIGLNPEWIPSFMTGNHDVNRAASWICDRVEDDDAAMKLYAAMIMLRSGIPYIYYGDELGMYGQNKSGDDWVEDSQIRLPMPFKGTTIDLEKVFYTMVVNDAGVDVGIMGSNMKKDWPEYLTTCTYDSTTPYVEDKIADEDSLYNTYKELITLRNEYKQLSLGTMSTVNDYNGSATIIGFTYENETIYVAFNFSEQALTLKNICDGTIELLHKVNGATVNGTSLEMAARGVAVFKVDGVIDTTPRTQYSLCITPADGSEAYFVPLIPGEEFEGYAQHVGKGVTLNTGDKVSFYNSYAEEYWGIQILNSYSSGKWTVQADGMICNEGGNYDIYVKMKYQQDEVYFGPAQ